ncbi:hypothetical protein ABZ622_02555 [Streptomyces sp. NPDC007164]|uniref:hypothetical protein n=1 Tax=Streptomyces sp. NPDC007164 TaxID=3156918 RepID=UPI0034099E42
MLARQYGYSVSEAAAARATPWAEGQFLAQRERGERSAHKTAWFGGIAMAVLVASFVVDADSAPGWAWLILAIPVIGAFLFVYVRGQGRRLWEEQLRQLREQPWQSWPVRGQEVRATSLSGPQRAALKHRYGASFVGVRLSLLSPQGAEAACFVTFMARDAWQGMTDGYGIMLVCGDLREACHGALPGRQSLLALTPGARVRWQGSGGDDARLIADVVSRAQGLDGLFG